MRRRARPILIAAVVALVPALAALALPASGARPRARAASDAATVAKALVAAKAANTASKRALAAANSLSPGIKGPQGANGPAGDAGGAGGTGAGGTAGANGTAGAGGATGDAGGDGSSGADGLAGMPTVASASVPAASAPMPNSPGALAITGLGTQPTGELDVVLATITTTDGCQTSGPGPQGAEFDLHLSGGSGQIVGKAVTGPSGAVAQTVVFGPPQQGLFSNPGPIGLMEPASATSRDLTITWDDNCDNGDFAITGGSVVVKGLS